MGELERTAVRRVVDELAAAGVHLPPELGRAVSTVLCGGGNTGARLWVEQHPDAGETFCCMPALDGRPEDCTCWRPVYDVEQAPPRPMAGPQDLQARPRMCGDCAFKPGSPERTDPLMVETLMELPSTRTPFWCHDGMRRPVRWEHPDGRTVAGDPADWHPAQLGRVPYRADGSPALLCAGWAALAARAVADG
jgi:hypothetical protein